MHNGGFATLEEVVDFYDRGGDFDDNKDAGFVMRLGLTAEEKSDLVVFLKNQLTDTRVEAESGRCLTARCSIPNPRASLKL